MATRRVLRVLYVLPQPNCNECVAQAANRSGCGWLNNSFGARGRPSPILDDDNKLVVGLDGANCYA